MRTIAKCTLLIGTLFATSTTTIAQDPVLTSITPSAAKQGQSLTVIITGFNTHFGPPLCFEQATQTDGWFFFEQGTPTQGTPTVTDIWLSQGSSTIDWIRGWRLYDTLFFALFDIPVDANAGKWDVNVDYVFGQGTPTVGNLTLIDGFTIAQPGDLTCDGAVNFFDVAVLSNYWLEGTDE